MDVPVPQTCVGTIPKRSVGFTPMAGGSSANVPLTSTTGSMPGSSETQPFLLPPYGTIRTTTGGLLEPSLIGSQSQSMLRPSDLSSLTTVLQQPVSMSGQETICAGGMSLLQPRGLTSSQVANLM